MGINIKLPFGTFYLRSPIKFTRKGSVRLIEDPEELVSVFGKPNTEPSCEADITRWHLQHMTNPGVTVRVTDETTYPK